MEQTINRNHNENRIAQKLRSETGASITYALLLFLVCAALSAVILVAATTASGRMSNISETDQRYYSVTSACEFLAETLGGGTASVIKFKGEEGNEIVFAKPMNQITNNDIEGIAEETIVDHEGDPKAKEKVGDLSELYKKLALACAGGGESSDELVLTSSLNPDPSKDPLAVNIEVSAGSERLKLLVSNMNGKPYTMLLEFSSDVRDALPSVTKNNLIKSSHEVSWHLTKMVSAYDAK